MVGIGLTAKYWGLVPPPVPASLKSALDGTKVIVKAYFLFIIYSSVFSKDELSPTKPIIICKNQA